MVTFDEVICKIADLFGDPELSLVLCRMSSEFDTDEKFLKSTKGITMKALYNQDDAFVSYVRNLYAEGDVDNVAKDVITAGQVLELHLDKSHIDIDGPVLSKNAMIVSGSLGFVKALSNVPSEIQLEVINGISQLTQIGPLQTVISDCLGKMRILGKHQVALAVVFLTFEGIKDIYLWYQGEMSGKRVIKKIVDNVVACGGGYAGSMAGIYLGTFAGPYGVLCGGLAGGVIGHVVTAQIIGYLTCRIFNVAKDEAVERAYQFFRVTRRSSNSEINSAFRKACKRHHPDRGGRHEEFLEIQAHMSLIKIARGEKFE